MATVNYSWNLPTVGASEDTWGTSLNANWTALDTLLGGVSQTEFAILDGATVSTAELNLLDGVTATTAEINTLDGITATVTELNLLDGITALTGADTEIVTGTAGTDGQLAQWNADGDIVGVDKTLAEATWEAGTDTTESLVSPAKVKAAIEAETVGWGQTWQDVSASRSLATSYQNTTGKPIFVVISATKNYSVSVSNDGTSWIELSNAGVEFSESGTSFVAPPQTYYKIESTGSGTAIRSWVELR